MDYRRIIPCLDVKDGRLVKGVHFVDLRDVGDPAESAAAYSEAGADELVFLDITASSENRATMRAAVQRTLQRITIPLTVGGGIRNLDDIQALLDLGVAKISLNTAAVKQPQLVEQAALRFGSQRVTVAIDTRRHDGLESGFEVVIRGGTQATGWDAVAWARQVEQRGAGTLLPTSMNTDGNQTGYDLPMTRALADAVQIPVIASGGAGKLEHLADAILQGHADAVLVASIAHFGIFTIRQMKDYLASQGIPVRRDEEPRTGGGAGA